ncbi:MAG: hypothetical protein U9N86_12370 [Bacteroidota bacterium]|nr:hypothetical protein [Bacteroidota bacterium]
MIKKIIIFILLILTFCYVANADEGYGRVVKQKRFYGLGFDSLQAYKDDINYDYFNVRNDMVEVSLGVFVLLSGKRTSKLTRLSDEPPGKIILSGSFGLSKIINDYKYKAREENSNYIQFSPSIGLSLDFEQDFIIKIFSWGGALNGRFGIVEDNDVVYTTTPSDIFAWLNKVHGTWWFHNWNLHIGCYLLENLKIISGYEGTGYEYVFRYSGNILGGTPLSAKVNNKLINQRWFSKLRWVSEKYSFDLLYRYPNDKTNTGTYSLGINYFI